jgi:hypothetical protein
MKKLNFLITATILFVSIQISAQISVVTQNTSAPTSCDGSACLDSVAVGNVNSTSIYWAGGGAILQQGSYCVDSLCSGTYTVTYIVNGNSVTSTFTIGSGSGNPCNSLTANVTTQPAQTSTSCDGSATCVVTGGNSPYTFLWSNGSIAQSTNFLCSGMNICCYITDMNGCVVQACDSVSSQSQSASGDTLIISGNNCNNPSGNIVMQIEDCTFDFNAVDTAYLSTVILGTTPIDSSTVLWMFVDTNGVSTTITSYSSGFNTSGCYNFTLILFCSQKSLDIKTIIVNGQYDYQSSGIPTLTNSLKQVNRITDLSGREVSNNYENGILIYHFTDGTFEKVFIWK